MKKKARKLLPFLPLYVMMLPGIAYLIINNYIPMTGIVVAFKQYNLRDGIYGSPWIGLSNFEYLFKNQDAWVMTRNTIGYNLVFIVLGTVLAIAVAIILNEVRAQAAKQLYQTLILIPYLISMVVVSYLVFAFLSDGNGFINKSILPLFGLEGISWYNEAQYWPVILTIVYIWKSIGYNCILYYATICGIDRSLYEAAVVDGANRWQQVWNVTLPCLKSTIIILTLMSLGNIFRSDFGLFYQVTMNSGTIISTTQTIDTYVYRALMSAGGIGRSAAASVFQSIVGFALVMTTNLVVRKVSAENAIF